MGVPVKFMHIAQVLNGTRGAQGIRTLTVIPLSVSRSTP
jgi:hypothetical protein